VNFDKRYEFNYGEDTDFGMQLRHSGEDVIYFADIKITHLKAPMGGYRTKVKQPWQNDAIVPKPSPTIYLLNRTYFTKQQLMGYKLLLALKSYRTSKNKNPFAFAKHFNKKWQRSQFWSEQLTNNQNA
jgi:GT2 family glycosyltransferase